MQRPPLPSARRPRIRSRAGERAQWLPHLITVSRTDAARRQAHYPPREVLRQGGDTHPPPLCSGFFVRGAPLFAMPVIVSWDAEKAGQEPGALLAVWHQTRSPLPPAAPREVIRARSGQLARRSAVPPAARAHAAAMCSLLIHRPPSPLGCGVSVGRVETGKTAEKQKKRGARFAWAINISLLAGLSGLKLTGRWLRRRQQQQQQQGKAPPGWLVGWRLARSGAGAGAWRVLARSCLATGRCRGGSDITGMSLIAAPIGGGKVEETGPPPLLLLPFLLHEGPPKTPAEEEGPPQTRRVPRLTAAARLPSTPPHGKRPLITPRRELVVFGGRTAPPWHWPRSTSCPGAAAGGPRQRWMTRRRLLRRTE